MAPFARIAAALNCKTEIKAQAERRMGTTPPKDDTSSNVTASRPDGESSPENSRVEANLTDGDSHRETCVYARAHTPRIALPHTHYQRVMPPCTSAVTRPVAPCARATSTDAIARRIAASDINDGA